MICTTADGGTHSGNPSVARHADGFRIGTIGRIDADVFRR
jgi:hypothetical protein